MEYNDGIKESLNNIFGAILVGGADIDHPSFEELGKTMRICVPKFLTAFPHNIFKDEYAIFYDIMTKSKVRVFSVAQLEEILDRHTDIITQSPFIDITEYAQGQNGNPTLPEEIVDIFKASSINLLKELSNKYVSEDEFNTACKIFKAAYVEDTSKQIVNTMALIMSSTGYTDVQTSRRSRNLKGVEAAHAYYREQYMKLQSLEEMGGVQSEILDAKWLANQQALADNIIDEDLMDTGIDIIDQKVGCIMRSHMLGILGPPKGGKTKFANYLTGRALEKQLNVVVWPLEGSKEEWIAMQQALMVAKQSPARLDSKQIQRRKFGSDQNRQLCESAKVTIATASDIGRISFLTGSAYVEDFIDVLEDHYKNKNPFDVIVIDSLVNILSRTGKGKTERISEAYMMLKHFISFRLPIRPIAILPAQLKQETVDYLRKNPTETIDVTAGGESAETMRSPDEVIGLFSTKDERSSGLMKMYHVASRHSEAFPDFRAKCDLGCCLFENHPEPLK